MAERYRLSWEMVDLDKLALYSNADPALFKNTTQTVPNSQIPDEHWRPVVKEFDANESELDQYRTLSRWEEIDYGFVRHVKLERMVGEPRWEEVDHGE